MFLELGMFSVQTIDKKKNSFCLAVLHPVTSTHIQNVVDIHRSALVVPISNFNEYKFQRILK